MDRDGLQAVLGPLVERIAPQSRYRLVGTAAAIAQGVRLPATDVDVLVARRDDVDTFVAALSGYPCRTPPTWLPEARQYFAAVTVGGIDLEISTVEWPAGADTLECAGPGPWRHYVEADLGRCVAPAVSLELRLVTELVRDRPDRYEPLLGHLSRHGADLPLLRRALRDRDVEPRRCERVLARIERTAGMTSQMRRS